MHNARPNPPGIQMHRSFRGAGKIPAPGQEKIKDPEDNFTRRVTPSNVATLH